MVCFNKDSAQSVVKMLQKESDKKNKNVMIQATRIMNIKNKALKEEHWFILIMLDFLQSLRFYVLLFHAWQHQRSRSSSLLPHFLFTPSPPIAIRGRQTPAPSFIFSVNGNPYCLQNWSSLRCLESVWQQIIVLILIFAIASSFNS